GGAIARELDGAAPGIRRPVLLHARVAFLAVEPFSRRPHTDPPEPQRGGEPGPDLARGRARPDHGRLYRRHALAALEGVVLEPAHRLKGVETERESPHGHRGPRSAGVEEAGLLVEVATGGA